MKTFSARARYDEAVSPIIAIMLLLAITVVLTSVMYLTVSQLVPSVQQNPQPLGVIVLRAGGNWIVEVASVGSGVDASHVYMEIIDPNGTTILHYTPLTNITGFQDDPPKDFLSAGDRVLLPLQTYPERSTFLMKDDQRLLVQGTLLV